MASSSSSKLSAVMAAISAPAPPPTPPPAAVTAPTTSSGTGEIDLSVVPITKDINSYSKVLYHVRWNCDGTFISAISADRSVKIHALDVKSLSLAMIQSIPTIVTMAQVCWHPQEPGKLALCGDDKAVEFWDVKSARASMKVTTTGGNLNMAWSPDGNYVVVGNKSDNLFVIDVRSGNQVAKKKFSYEVNELSWTYNSDYIIAASAGEGSGAVELLSFCATSGELTLVQSLVAHSSNCFNLAMDPLYKSFAVSSFDGCVSLWDLYDMSCMTTLTMDTEAKSLTYSGDGKYIAICCDETGILVCDAATGEPLTKVTTRCKPLQISWNPKFPVLSMICEDKLASPTQYMKLISFPTK